MNSELIHADESKKLIQALIAERRKINSARPGETYHFLPVDNFSSRLSNYAVPNATAHPSDTSERSVNFRFADNSQTIRDYSVFSAPHYPALA